MEPVSLAMRLQLTKMSFNSVRVVKLSRTSVVFLFVRCHCVLGVRSRPLMYRCNASVFTVLSWEPYPDINARYIFTGV
jgi:hypothetical protein